MKYMIRFLETTPFNGCLMETWVEKNELFNAPFLTKISKIFRCKLGFERIPFDDNSFDYITAYDLIEHIPRYSDSENSNTPFIQLMNECYRVLKKDGIFLSMTPVYPYLGAFQDPTHNNIITVDTFKHYFSEDKFKIAFHYGVTANFRILDQKMYGQHLIAVLTKWPGIVQFSRS